MIVARTQPPSPARRIVRRLQGWRREVGVALTGVICLLGVMVIPVVTSAPTPAAAASNSVPSYWLVATDGGVFSFGGLPNYGSMGGQRLNKPIVGMAATPNSGGYWMVASDGGIFSFGNASFHGSMGGVPLNKPIVGMAATPDGGGYWLVASDGGIFSFGDAAFHGSTGAIRLNQPVVSMAPTRDGGGYWLVASDGGIFAFGDAAFHGSTGAIRLNRPVVSMAATAAGGGYWLVASDGGIFAFGDAPYYGSAGGENLSRPIVAMDSTPNNSGYWLTDGAGLVFNFGGAGYYGSAPPHLNAPIVAMAEGPGSGGFGANPIPSGSYGYDVSKFQCGNLPPPPHQIGVVEVTGASYSFTNPCMASEAAWAGAGLNLYVYLTYGLTTTGAAICNGFDQDACYAGYGASQYAFAQAQAAGVNTSVTWWLDVEHDPSWSTDLAANAMFVQGAVEGLRAEGVNNVGIYTSVLSWPGIVGGYRPQLPLWAAWYTGNPQQNCATAYSYAAGHGSNLPSGGVWMTQYTDNAGGFDGDYAC
ncbi:MAG TPA: hypothetical protein VG205_11545 [Acidimicrobiales bacterium]|nr:hypothetical protein [Acidimicrobiales bacterium]